MPLRDKLNIVNIYNRGLYQVEYIALHLKSMYRIINGDDNKNRYSQRYLYLFAVFIVFQRCKSR